VLVDSSVWIAYLRGDDWVEVAMLTEALEHRESVWLTATDAREAARSAAHLYARCRWAGVTPRSANDCLIATYAIFAGIPLLHRDRDFELIAGVEPKLMLVPAKQG
jgi:predicted nucleic acid-binding protein